MKTEQTAKQGTGVQEIRYADEIPVLLVDNLEVLREKFQPVEIA